MELGPLTKVKAATAAELCARSKLEPPGHAMLSGDEPPAALLGRLIEGKLYRDAVRLLAQALPKREAVWWACLCAHAVLPAKKEPADAAALKAAERWVVKPSEAHRSAAMPAARAAGFEQPASWAAVAVSWSGGSMMPEGHPAMPPGDELTGQAVANAVLLAGLQGDATRIAARFRDFLERGIDLAKGGTGKKAGDAPGAAAPSLPL